MSGLVLNFVPDPVRFVVEAKRVTVPGGVVGAYVCVGLRREMQMMRRFWDAAIALDPAARSLEAGGLEDVGAGAIDVETVFRDFDDYWTPFLGGQAPAPDYCMSLDERRRVTLRERLRETLPVSQDGSIPLLARAWMATGRVRAATSGP